MLATWRGLIIILSSMVIMWTLTVMRERRRAGDYMSGEFLAIGLMLYSLGAIFHQVFAWYEHLRFSPASILFALGSLSVLYSMYRVLHHHTKGALASDPTTTQAEAGRPRPGRAGNETRSQEERGA